MKQPSRKPQKRKVRVKWADHVLKGHQRRTSAKRMKLSPVKGK